MERRPVCSNVNAQQVLREDNVMTNMENFKKPRNRARLLDLLKKIATSVAMANHVPTGAGAIASGQVGAAARDGRLSHEVAQCRAADGGPSGNGAGTPCYSNA